MPTPTVTTDDGFSLVELLVAVTITLLLGGVVFANPELIRTGGADTQAQGTATAALDAARTLHGRDGTLPAAPAALTDALLDINPRLQTVAATVTSTGPDIASIAVATDRSTVGVAARSTGGTCWLTLGNRNGDVVHAAGPDTVACTGVSALHIPSPTTALGDTWGTPYLLGALQ